VKNVSALWRHFLLNSDKNVKVQRTPSECPPEAEQKLNSDPKAGYIIIHSSLIIHHSFNYIQALRTILNGAGHREDFLQ
jgi:hypothetical protein